MSATVNTGRTMPHEVGETPSRRQLVLYLLPFILLPIFLFTFSLIVLPTRWFEQRAANSYLANIGYATKLHHMDCEVVVYGDSSAMMGVDPAIVSAKTGLKTCNIAEFEAITLMDRMSIVDIYLRNNTRPKFLIFLFVPDDLTLHKDWAGISTFEAITFNLQYDRTARTIGQLFAHPKETFGWSELGLRMLTQHFHSAPAPAAVMNQRENDRGLFRYTETSEKTCKKWNQDAPPDPAWLASLRSTYGVGGTKVLIDATPTASCDPSLGYYQEHVTPYIDNLPYSTIPIQDFQDNGHLHANSRGVKLISAMIAEQVMAHMGSDGSEANKTALLQGGR